MALYGTLASLSQTAASNAADGAVDAPSTIDQQTNLLASFIAQLRDGNGFATGLGNVAQCQLAKSGSNLVLAPFGGNGLTINGVVYKIPSAGVSLVPTSLSVGTSYNIYAYMNAGTMTLEASTTAKAADTTTGMPIKSGDATRTLVGKARIITGPAWADTDAQRFVISWFNQRPKRIYNVSGSLQSTTSTTPVPISALMEFLSWGDSIVSSSFNSSVSNNTANSIIYTALGFNTNSAASMPPAVYQAYANSSNSSATGTEIFVPSEGYNYICTVGYVSGGTGTWAAGFDMNGVVQG
ncbi:hypothetical protein J7E70_07755 [Variovorax paradoxus]|nr:hypothetical protein [Variovorax paradoxus]MBT2300357.1 hypothetical protein [Variovorax paradoxus]